MSSLPKNKIVEKQHPTPPASPDLGLRMSDCGCEEALGYIIHKTTLGAADAEAGCRARDAILNHEEHPSASLRASSLFTKEG